MQIWWNIAGILALLWVIFELKSLLAMFILYFSFIFKLIKDCILSSKFNVLLGWETSFAFLWTHNQGINGIIMIRKPLFLRTFIFFVISLQCNPNTKSHVQESITPCINKKNTYRIHWINFSTPFETCCNMLSYVFGKLYLISLFAIIIYSHYNICMTMKAIQFLWCVTISRIQFLFQVF